MGNSNTKKYHYAHRQYASQYSISDILGGQCVGTPRASCEELRPWSRFSRRSWSDNTLNNPLSLSKTAWPVPRFEAIFLPEFPVKETPLKNEYVFIDIISKGAYGRVYKVQKKETREVFALKIISKAQIVAENSIDQAKQEVSIQRAVGHHTFIANSPYHWQGRKTLYILTQFIGGGELFSLVEEYGCLSEDVVRIYIGEIALALDFLHNAGIIHRDLKASNILLDNEGHAMLIDFGLAKWLRPLQRTGTFCGTFEYMAPEIVKRQYYGHEADWWSLGVLACFLLTNQYPGKNITSDLLENEEYKAVSFGTLPESAESSLSPGAIDLLKRLLQPEPRLRIKSVLALQRIAFYMGHDIRSYTLKKVSPFQLLGKRIESTLTSLVDDFNDFDSFVGAGSTTRTWAQSTRSG
ncbi:serine/threonine-protein kinase S6KL [Nasonia vitripennis]|uniref:Protein kinase domain-containing protein n=1 Tax=Nasonia vitripennis TaxID=7425 RepID=A0A7M7T729_NASVI|nr:serine/threonine-protein kinase S6KL [Nasonia vitripennis]XP_031779119.1 serine/threonine-protein kinase S6KL [Nasonia vitripennis]